MSCLIAFSGQGRQYAKMFDFLKKDEFGKLWLSDASRVLGKNMMDEAVIETYSYDILYSQLWIALLSIGACRAIQQQYTFEPLLCGYSLGEVSAFCVSTGLPIEKICELIEMRVKCMQDAMDKATQHRAAGLVALKGNINNDMVNELSKSYHCYVAIINDHDHYIIGGEIDNINQLMDAAKSAGVSKVEKLAVKVPSHTPLLTDASPIFLSYLQKNYQDLTLGLPILNAMTAEITTSTSQMLTILSDELSHTLHWDNVLRIAGEYQVSTFLELGPRSDLKHMFTAINPDIKAYALEDFETVKGIVAQMT